MTPEGVRVPPGNSGPDRPGLLRGEELEGDSMPRCRFDAEDLAIEWPLALEGAL
jgi:hypothetical protein